MIPRKIGFFVFPDFQLLDAAGPIAAFEIAGRYAGGAYALHTVALAPGAVASTAGVTMAAEALQAGDRFDTLIVMGGEGSRAPAADPATLALIRAVAANARRMASVCSGAYVLAAAGLLDGRRATTHWNRSADFARRFPRVRLEPDRIYVRDGAIWTSAGITAGIDLALAMVAEDLGEEIARRTAEQLVVYRRRPGGQSQFSALLELERPGGRFDGLIGWVGERLHEPLSVERLASQAAMSPRNFARAFAAETGMTPARAVERLRVEAARERVEAGAEPIDAVARGCGFNDPERMRRAFLRAFAQPPQALRRAARAA
jgi:transcriptional regulator GlxA family with amidase domain